MANTRIVVDVLGEVTRLVIESLAVLRLLLLWGVIVTLLLHRGGQELSPRFGTVAQTQSVVVVLLLGGEELPTLASLVRSAHGLRSVKHRWGVRGVRGVSDAEGRRYGGHVSMRVMTATVTEIAVICGGGGGVTVAMLVGAVTSGVR